MTTGLRRGELLALQWEDLNEKTGELHITKQVYRTKEDGLLISQPKTKSSIRTIILPPPMLAIPLEYRTTADSRWKVPAPVKGDPAVTSGESGAVGMGALSVLLEDPAYAPLRRALELDRDSQVLLFSTEGDTDPEQYRKIVWEGEYASI